MILTSLSSVILPTSFTASASTTVSEHVVKQTDSSILKNIVEELNNPIESRSSRAHSFRLTLSNQEAKNLDYNLGKATEAAGIIAIIAGLGGITAILNVAVAVAGITAGGLANQINYRNNGKGVTLDVSLTGIVVKSR